jgi:hypothetical protein
VCTASEQQPKCTESSTHAGAAVLAQLVPPKATHSTPHLQQLDGAAREALLSRRERFRLIPPHHPSVHALAGCSWVATLSFLLIWKTNEARSRGEYIKRAVQP